MCTNNPKTESAVGMLLLDGQSNIPTFLAFYFIFFSKIMTFSMVETLFYCLEWPKLIKT